MRTASLKVLSAVLCSAVLLAGCGGNDDPPPAPGALQFSAATYTVAENVTGGTVTITVTRTGGSAGAASVTFATSNGSATAGSDYTTAGGTLNWAAGETASKTFNVTITNDAALESTETVNLTLSGATGATLGTQSTATLSITDNDTQPATGALQFNAATYTVAENVAGGIMTITVTRTGGSDGTASVTFATSDDTATAGSDYTANTGTLSWTAGDAASKTFNVTITNDVALESTETVNLTLSGATGATLGTQSTAVLSITDDDTPPAPGTLQFSAATYTVAEDVVGGTVTITVTRINGSADAASVTFATSDDTATAGSDYTANTGTLSWTAGDAASKTFNVTITNDATFESTETVNLTLSGATGATLGTQSTAVLSITNDDTAPAATNTLLPFLTGDGELKLFDPTLEPSVTNPGPAIDTGLAPPPTGVSCNDCFEQAQGYFSGTLTNTAISNIHVPRLAYIKGGSVFVVNLVQGQSHAKVQISSITDACKIVSTDGLGDFQNIDNSIVVIQRAGTGNCTTSTGNVATVIRLNSPTTGVGSGGDTLPLLLNGAGGEPLVSQRDANGVITGHVSFDSTLGVVTLVRRDASFLSPTTLRTLVDTNIASIRSTDFTHLFVTANTVEDGGQRLLRVAIGGLSATALYDFTSNAFFNPLSSGTHDATNLYFTDGGSVVRIPQDAAATGSADVMTTVPLMESINNMELDTGSSPTRVVFDVRNNSTSPITGGIYSVATNAAVGTTATLLADYPVGGFAELASVAQTRSYINLLTATNFVNAKKIKSDGSTLEAPVETANAYWAGQNIATSFDFATTSQPPAQFIFLATRSSPDDTLKVVAPATGEETGITLGTVSSTAQGVVGVNAFGIGNFALVNAEIDRSGVLDMDVYFIDATTAALPSLAVTSGANDIALDSN